MCLACNWYWHRNVDWSAKEFNIVDIRLIIWALAIGCVPKFVTWSKNWVVGVVLKSDALLSDFCNICFKDFLNLPLFGGSYSTILCRGCTDNTTYGLEFWVWNKNAGCFLLVIFGVDYVTWTDYVTSHIYWF